VRKFVVVLGLVLIVVGVVVATYQVDETYADEVEVGSWGKTTPIWPSTLNGTGSPGNRTIWGVGGMSRYSWFEFSLAFSGDLRVTVAAVANPQNAGEEPVAPVFDETGSSVFRRVNVGEGTWQVDIFNEGLVPVDILPGSFVVAKESVAVPEVGYPYTLPGTLVALLGVVVLVVGVVSRGRVKRKKG
jgi:hypothetical protein